MRTPLSTHMLSVLMAAITESRQQADHFRGLLEGEAKQIFEGTEARIPFHDLSLSELKAKLSELSEIQITEFLARYTECQTVITDIYDVYVKNQIDELQAQIAEAKEIINI